MAKTRFNHSYTHCKGNGCEFADDCVHHLAYLEAIELNIKDIKIIEVCTNPDANYYRVRIEKK